MGIESKLAGTCDNLFYQGYLFLKRFSERAAAALPYFTTTIVLPLIAMALPCAAAVESSELIPTGILSENSTAVSVVQNTSLAALGVFQGLAMLGAVGVGHHINRTNRTQEVEYDFIPSTPDLDLENADEEPALHVFEQFDLKGVYAGSVAMIAAPSSSFNARLIIAGQRFLNISSFGFNATHAGIVAHCKDDSSMLVREIPDAQGRLSENSYHIADLPLHEQWIFFNLTDVLPEKERSEANRYLLEISNLFVDRLHKNENSNYNFYSLPLIPFSPQTFEKAEWVSLLNDWIEFELLSKDPTYQPQHKRYFCSEFVLNSAQLARLMQKYPHFRLRIQEELLSFGEEDRINLLDKLYQEGSQTGIFQDLVDDPLFFVPSDRSTPGHLMDFAVRHRLPMIRVQNSIFSQPDLASSWAPEDLKKLQNLLGTLQGEDADHPDLAHLIDYLKNFSPFSAYTEETLKCLLKYCSIEKESSCVASCIDRTFSWAEKIRLVLTSLAIDFELDRMIETKKLDRVLDAIKREGGNLSIQKMVDHLYLNGELGFLDKTWILDYFVRIYLNHFLSSEDLYKYGPLGTVGMKEIFERVGKEYRSPIERIISAYAP